MLGKRGLLSGIQAVDKWIPDINTNLRSMSTINLPPHPPVHVVHRLPLSLWERSDTSVALWRVRGQSLILSSTRHLVPNFVLEKRAIVSLLAALFILISFYFTPHLLRHPYYPKYYLYQYFSVPSSGEGSYQYATPRSGELNARTSAIRHLAS